MDNITEKRLAKELKKARKALEKAEARAAAAEDARNNPLAYVPWFWVGLYTGFKKNLK